MNKSAEIYKELLSKLHVFKGDEFCEEHISELLELIDPLYEKAWMYDDLSK